MAETDDASGGRDERGRFARGHGGGPGRPKGAAGLARYIGEQTDDGRELVDRLLVLAREGGKDAQAAVMALLDRYAGRPVQAIDQRSLIAHAEVRALPSAEAWARMTPAEQERFLSGGTTAFPLAMNIDTEELDGGS